MLLERNRKRRYPWNEFLIQSLNAGFMSATRWQGEKMTYCAKCGTLNPENAGYCQRCGAKLQPAQNITQPQSEPGISTTNNFYGRLPHRDRRRLRRESQGAAPSVFAEKEVIHEIVLVPCAYCGSLFPQTSMVCPHCGAKRKA